MDYYQHHQNYQHQHHQHDPHQHHYRNHYLHQRHYRNHNHDRHQNKITSPLLRSPAGQSLNPTGDSPSCFGKKLFLNDPNLTGNAFFKSLKSDANDGLGRCHLNKF